MRVSIGWTSDMKKAVYMNGMGSQKIVENRRKVGKFPSKRQRKVWGCR
jgi:hypothetical protein